MSPFSRLTAPLVVAATIVACSSGEQPRNVELAPPAATSTPTLRDVQQPSPQPQTTAKAPAKSTPARTNPVTPPVPTPVPVTAVAPPATSPAPVYGTFAAGTEFRVEPSTKVCTNTHKVGDQVVAHLTESVTGSDGARIPTGAVATLEVTQSTYGKNDEKAVRLAFKVVSVSWDGVTHDLTSADVVSAPVTTDRRQSTGTQAGKIATGAVVGAVIGRVIGKDTKGAVVGGAVGAAGGAAVAHKTADYDGCVAQTARLVVRLAQPLRIRVT